MNLRNLAFLVLAIAPAGCVIEYRDPPPRRVYVEAAPAPAPVVITEQDEVNYVVYREYFGCTDVEVSYMPHYIHYYGCTSDDLYFCWFVSRRCGLAFDVCWRTYWYDCGRSCDRMVLWYNVPRASFFVAVGPGVTYPPVYQNTYVWYSSGARTNVVFTNTEYVALVHMKVGVEYQGHPPATFFAEVRANNGNTARVLVQNRASCGNGGKSVTGAAVVATAPRPWTMPPQQRQAWQQQQKTQVVKSETAFKENPAHKEQVQKVQAQQGPSRTRSGGASRSDDRHAAPGRNEPGHNPASSRGDQSPRGTQGESGPRGNLGEHSPKTSGQGPEHASKQGQAEHSSRGEQPRSKGEEPRGKGSSGAQQEEKGKKGEK